MNTDKRTDDEINRIIAEWCGWDNVHNGFGDIIRYGRTESEQCISGLPIPNYCRDLNAVHEACQRLNREELVDYCAFKLRYTTGEGCSEDYKMINATARQRAEALVKMIESAKQ